MQEKKLYFSYDDGDYNSIGPFDAIIEMMRANADSLEKNPEDIELYDFTITPVFLTDEEYEALPED